MLKITGLKKYLSIAVFVFFSLILCAQVPDSTKRSKKLPVASYFTEEDFSPANLTGTVVDTSMDGIQKYFPNNFPYALSLAGQKHFFEPASDIGFDDGLNNLDLFGYNKRDIKYYRTRTPYTEVFALFGIKKEQFAKLLHTQNITRRWNLAFSMLRINMLGALLNEGGFYQRQGGTDNNLSVSSHYSSENNRYSFLVNGIVSSIKTDENGGIRNDTLFENDPFENKKRIPVNLMNARSKRRYRSAYMKHSVSFGKKENILQGDSVTNYRILPKNSFSYSLNVQDNIFMYAESALDSGYYENIYFDSTKTHDSTRVFVLQHGGAWTYFITNNITTELSFNQQTSHLFQYKTDSLLAIDTLIRENSIYWKTSKRGMNSYANGFYWNASGGYIVSGSNKGDYIARGNLSRVYKNNTKISLGILTDLHAVPFVFQSYSSNHFWWKNSFNKISETQAKLNYQNLKYKFFVEAKWNQITNYVNFDNAFSPQQFIGPFTIHAVTVEKKFYLKKIRFNNKITWQEASDEIIRLPTFMTSHSLYLEDKWFKNLIDVQLGFDVSFFTAYYVNAYMPALGLYYLQNEKKIGNYPFIDFFFKIKIKHARLFIKSEHVNAGLLGATYYLAPHIPAPDRSFKVGLNWMFFD